MEEITAEKLRCIIQRVQCRDLKDLFRLTGGLKVPLADVTSLFDAKTRIKGLDPASFPERFEDRVETSADTSER
jgi:predicted nucleotidyltransferase component of viral defense system